MTEVITTFLITATSIFLFVYWFRYTCMLILSAKTARDYTADVAMANRLGFIEIQSRLQGETAAAAESFAMDRLVAALHRDYEIVQRLMEQTANLGPRRGGFERYMLQAHYRMAGVWYRCCSRLAPATARRALEQMSLVIAHFANTMGEQLAASA